jgi:hypothetical protein
MNLSDPPFYRLAVRSADLSDRIGFDWSFPYSWSLANVLADQGLRAAFIEVARRAGSVVTYDAIPANRLLVCPKGLDGESDPASWLPLSTAKPDELARFETG